MMPSEEQIPKKFTVVPYYVTAALAFVLATGLCIVAAPAFTGHFFQPKLLAITHLTALGWAILLIFGASNQLVPVIAEQKLYSEKLPLWVLGVMVAGVSLLVYTFWHFSITMLGFAGGGLILLGFILHAFNLFKTFGAGKASLVAHFMRAAHAWLIITAVLGLLLLVNLRYPFLPVSHLHYLKIHATVGIAGWFLQLVIGVSSRLIPMFLLSRTEKTAWLNYTYYLVNGALLLFFVSGMVFRSIALAPVSLLMVLAGLVFYFRYVAVCRKSAMRKKTDQGLKQTFLALLLLAVPFVLLVLHFVKVAKVSASWTMALGFSFFAGFISVIIMGQTFKTLPFVVWMHINRPSELPGFLPADLYREDWVKWQMYLYFPGYLLFLSGILLQQVPVIYTGAAAMFVAASFYCIHVIMIVRKLVTYVHRH